MIFSTLDIQDIIVIYLVNLSFGVSHSYKLCQVVDFLFCDGQGVIVVQTAQVNVFVSLVGLIDFVEDLPGNVEFYLLADEFHLVIVLLAVYLVDSVRYVIVYLVVKLCLCFLHVLIENLVVFCSDDLVTFSDLFVSGRCLDLVEGLERNAFVKTILLLVCEYLIVV